MGLDEFGWVSLSRLDWAKVGLIQVWIWIVTMWYPHFLPGFQEVCNIWLKYFACWNNSDNKMHFALLCTHTILYFCWTWSSNQNENKQSMQKCCYKLLSMSAIFLLARALFLGHEISFCFLVLLSQKAPKKEIAQNNRPYYHHHFWKDFLLAPILIFCYEYLDGWFWVSTLIFVY